MKRLKVRFRASANADLLTILEYVFDVSRSVATARGFTRRIHERCLRIGDAPMGGRVRDDLFAGLRTVPFERSAVIAYTVEDDCVRITNVFHGGRDYEALYRGE